MNLVKMEVMVSKIGHVTVRPSSKKDPYGRRTLINEVLYKSCGNWINERCAMIKRAANRLAVVFQCRKCIGCHKNVEDQKEKLLDDVETVT